MQLYNNGLHFWPQKCLGLTNNVRGNIKYKLNSELLQSNHVGDTFGCQSGALVIEMSLDGSF